MEENAPACGAAYMYQSTGRHHMSAAPCTCPRRSKDALVLEYDSALPTNPIREGHPRIPEAEKAKLWWSHEDLQGFALEELNRQRPDRPSVSKQASKQAQQRNNLDVAHACFEERMPRSSSSAVSERLLPALPAMGI